MNYIRITKENIDREHICCAMSGKQSLAKKEWMKQRFDEGLVFYRSEERGKCFIEYIPADFCVGFRVQQVVLPANAHAPRPERADSLRDIRRVPAPARLLQAFPGTLQ